MSETSHQHFWIKSLEKQKNKGLFRTLHHAAPYTRQSHLLDFTSNDYLQLSSHPAIRQAAIHALQTEGAGKCSSRLISGGYTLLEQLEQELALWYGKEQALLFPSGYQANVACLSALLTPSSLVIADKYIHRSLIDGILLSQAKLLRYPHADLQAMTELLQKVQGHYKHIVCITESVFSMQGTAIDVDAFCKAAEHFGALSYIDDAHGFGVLSKDEKTRMHHADIVLATLSKGMGVQGGAILGSKLFAQYLINFAKGFIYTTSVAPPIAGAALAALRLLPSLQKTRMHLWDLNNYFFLKKQEEGWTNSTQTPTHIQPIYLEQTKALYWQEKLNQKQIQAITIRHPTVPINQSLLRFSLCAAHSKTSIDQLFFELRKLK